MLPGLAIPGCGRPPAPPVAAGQGSPPWTAARCRRLLRPLLANLSALRKLSHDKDLSSSHSPPPAQKRCRPAECSSRPSKRVRLTYRRSAMPPPPVPCPPTITKTPPRRPSRALGTMKLAMAANFPSPAAGQVELRTPIWRKIREQPETPPPPSLSPPRQRPYSETSNSFLAAELHSLRPLMNQERYRIHEALFSRSHRILQATRPQAGDPDDMSLLAICLRALPDCMAHIEDYERHLARERGSLSLFDESDITPDLYRQLEALGSSVTGWRGLKLAIRSHAVSLLSEAASQGHLEPAFVALLTRLCLHLKCYREAGQLTASVEGTLPSPQSHRSKLTENKKCLPLLGMVESFASNRARGAALNCAVTLVRSRLLPAAWLSTQALSSLWISTLEGMTTSRLGFPISAFISSCLPIVATGFGEKMGKGTNDGEQTLISVCAGLVVVAMAVTDGLPDEKDPRRRRRRRAYRRVLHVLDQCVAEVCHSRQPSEDDDGLFIFALARHLAARDDSSLADPTFGQLARLELESLARKAACCSWQHGRASLLLCTIARYRSRACGMPARDVLLNLCSMLDGLGMGSQFQQGLGKEAAFLLAQRTRDLRDLVFAETLPNGNKGSTSGTLFSGWSWEEGISEWVQPRDEVDASTADNGRAVPLKRARAGGRSTVNPSLVLTRQRGRSQAATSRESKVPLRIETVTSVGVSEQKDADAAAEELSGRASPRADFSVEGRQAPTLAKRPLRHLRQRPSLTGLLGLLPVGEDDEEWDDLL